MSFHCDQLIPTTPPSRGIRLAHPETGDRLIRFNLFRLGPEQGFLLLRLLKDSLAFLACCNRGCTASPLAPPGNTSQSFFHRLTAPQVLPPSTSSSPFLSFLNRKILTLTQSELFVKPNPNAQNSFAVRQRLSACHMENCTN